MYIIIFIYKIKNNIQYIEKKYIFLIIFKFIKFQFFIDEFRNNREKLLNTFNMSYKSDKIYNVINNHIVVYKNCQFNNNRGLFYSQNSHLIFENCNNINDYD